MAYIPTQSSRLPTVLSDRMFADSVRARNTEVGRTGLEAASGRKLNLPSDNPGDAALATDIRFNRDRQEQYVRNAQAGTRSLNATETVLGSFRDALDRARALAVSAADGFRNGADQLGAIGELDTMIDSLLARANDRLLNRYVMGGSRVDQEPFRRDGQGIVFTGDNAVLESLKGVGELFPLNVTANSSIGTDSAAGRGGNLNPNVTAATRLVDLNGGLGVEKGTIAIDAGTGSGLVSVDLSQADTLGDVVTRINADVPGAAATLTSNGIQITGAPGPVIVRDIGAGRTAFDLGIRAESVATVTGRDLDPILSLTTPLTALNAGGGISLAGDLQIDNGPYSATIDVAGATTVEDVLNRINSAGVRVRAEINGARDGINVVNTLAGSGFSIKESSAGFSTVSNLRIRTTDLDTPLADFNNGAGVNFVTGADLRITIHDTTASNLAPPVGGTFEFDLNGARTIRDVKTIVESQSGGRIAIGVDGFGQIVVQDGTSGPGPFTVSSPAPASAAEELGITGSAGAGGTVGGVAKHQARVKGVFDSLLRLRDAIRNNDAGGVTIAAQQLNVDRDRLLAASGALGNAAQAVEAAQGVREDDVTRLKTAESDLVDVDLAEVVTRLLSQQNALQATLSVTGRLVRQSLLDFLQ
jgi:flagellin-like hook-associated protein FlgL